MIFPSFWRETPLKTYDFLSNFHRAKFALLGFVADETNLTGIFTIF